MKKRILAFLYAFVFLISGVSEQASPVESIALVELKHMLETLSGGYSPAESTMEEPNPEYIPADAFSETVNQFERDYPGFSSEKVNARKDENGNYTYAEIIYTRNAYVLMIEYFAPDGMQILPAYMQNLLYGADYSVASPDIPGYAPDIKVVSGTMGTNDISVAVVYSKTDTEPDEPVDPSTPGEPATPDEPVDPSTPGEPATPDEPDDPSTPGEPENKPGGGRPGGSRPGGNNASVTVISPGQPATSYHAMGKRDLSAHWQGAVESKGSYTSQLNLDDGSAKISFSGAEGAFTSEMTDDGAFVLSSCGEGTWEVNGFALKILRESGYDTLILHTNDAQIVIDTHHPASSHEYALLKAQGVGERRITYSYRMTDAGVAFALYADGEKVTDQGLYTLLRKENDGW